jgi:hypothetical protein
MMIPVLASLTPLPLFAGEQVPRANFYVATDGQDQGPGTQDQPFATLARARDAVRDLIKAGLKADVTVLIRGGMYELAEPLTFGPEDSGTEQFAVTYRAYPGESVVVSGGRHIAGWQRGDGDLWVAQVPGVREGQWYFRHLFVNGRRAVRARTPNPDADPPCWQLQGASLSEDLTSHTYQFAPDQLREWRNLSDVEAVVFGNWEITRKRFQSVDPAAGTAQMAGPHARPHDAMAPSAGRWFYLENAYEALDQPGEWYLDRPAGLLYYWPRPEEDLRNAEVIAPQLTCLLEVQGTPERPVRNLHFQGLQWAYADWFPPEGGYLGIQACHFATGTGWAGNPWGRIDAAIRWNDADSCSLRDGAIAHLGGCGIEWVTRCRNNTVEGNQLFDISANGVLIGGPREEENVPRDIRVANNHIHACGLDYYGAVGVWVGFAQRTVIAHNEVHDLPYSGISVGWQWNPEPTPCRENVIEYNHIYDVMNRLGDGGGIYTLGLQPGTVLRGNHIHDVHRSPLAQAAPNNGMFIDEGSKGFLFERNVIYNTSAEPVRFNQCSREWHTWQDNHFGELSALPEALREVITQAGLEPPYRERQ